MCSCIVISSGPHTYIYVTKECRGKNESIAVTFPSSLRVPDPYLSKSPNLSPSQEPPDFSLTTYLEIDSSKQLRSCVGAQFLVCSRPSRKMTHFLLLPNYPTPSPTQICLLYPSSIVCLSQASFFFYIPSLATWSHHYLICL